MEDFLEDELKIMQEQDAEPTAISAKAFSKPIKSMGISKVFTVDESTTIHKAISIMQEKKFGSLLVTKDGKLTGIFTERDLLNKVVLKLNKLEDLKISQVMTKDPIALREDDMIAYVLNNMHIGGYRHVPIVDGNMKPLYNISVKDVVSFVLNQFPKEITNVLSEPYRGGVKREGA